VRPTWANAALVRRPAVSNLDRTGSVDCVVLSGTEPRATGSPKAAPLAPDETLRDDSATDRLKERMDERYRRSPHPRTMRAPPHLRRALSPSSYSLCNSIMPAIRATTAGSSSFGGRPWASLPWATHSENHSSYEVKHCSEQSTAQERRSLGRLAVSSPQKAHRLRTTRSMLLGEPRPRHTAIEPIA